MIGYLTGILVVLAPGIAQASECRMPPAAALATEITPVTLRVLQARVTPVPATDGAVHLAYAAQVTNVGRDPVEITAIVPVDGAQGFAATGHASVLDVDGQDITGMVRPFASSGNVDTRRLAAGGSGIAFFDVRYRTGETLPGRLSHRVSIVVGGKRSTELVEGVEVDCAPPVVISPPLIGPRWWDGNGCCTTIGPHRGATLPVNGRLKAPEQFAIDFVQIRRAGDCCTGPVKDLRSWPFFGAPVLAAADGVVVERSDGMMEQVPGEVVGIDARNAAGNHIIEDIGNGRYVLYAHLKTGTIPGGVQVGTRLLRGEPIGGIGNTGSSTAPHLHFQVMDRPSALDATGLPFVFDRQVVQGRVIGTARRADDEFEAGRRVTVQPDAASLSVDRMPAEGQVFSFNPK